MEIKEKIDKIIKEHKVVLFMKGSKMMPQCGFSAAVVGMLKSLEVDFFTVDVLQDPEIRQGIKDFSNWPTLPQLYIDQKFIGGCDIATEMFQSGELQKLIEKEKN